MWVYFNGAFMHENQATLSVNNRGFRFGDGCFETMKMVKGRLVNAHLHTDRLFHTLRQLQFKWPNDFTAAEIINKIEAVAARNQHQALARIRLTAFRGDGSLHDIENVQPNMLIQSWPLPKDYDQLNEEGWNLHLYSQGHKACDALANLKSNNYLLYTLAAMQAKQRGFHDAIVLNEHGRVADTSIANIWIVEKGKLITPPLSEGPVAGTMRRYLLENAHGIETVESTISIERLKQAEEVWLTNALYGLKWVKQFEDKSYANQLAQKMHHQILRHHLPT